jgi:hypothetical protein
MDKANVAEWILRRVVDSSRAAELVGDQLESHPSDGRLRFWLLIVRLFLVFSWPTLISYVLAVIGGLLFSFYPFLLAMSVRAPWGHHGSPTPIFETIYYLLLSVLLWVATTFSLVRFGFRSELSRVGLIGALLCTAAACLLWLPHVPAALLVLTIACALFYLSSSRRRRALGILSIVVALGWLTTRLLVHPPAWLRGLLHPQVAAFFGYGSGSPGGSHRFTIPAQTASCEGLKSDESAQDIPFD